MLKQRSAAQGGKADAYEMLTSRERQVLHLAAEGFSNPAIAEKLGISPSTAETHRANVMRKLGLRTRRDLIVYAVKRGLLPESLESTLLAPDDPLRAEPD